MSTSEEDYQESESGEEEENENASQKSSESEDEEEDKQNDSQEDEDGDDSDDDEEESEDEDKEESEVVKPENGIHSGDETPKQKIPFNIAKNDYIAKLEQTSGKQLFLRFPKKLPNDKVELEKKVKALCDRIICVHKARQKWARFCTVDFDSVEDRTKAMKELANVEIDGKKLFVGKPRTEQKDFQEKIAESVANKREKRKIKVKLNRLLKKAAKNEKFTSTILVSNVPTDTVESELKKIFPAAINLNLNFANNKKENNFTAAVTFPTPRDATKASKGKHTIGSNELKIKFAIKRNKPPGKPTNTPAADKQNENKKVNKKKLNKNKKKPTVTPTEGKQNENETVNDNGKLPNKNKLKRKLENDGEEKEAGKKQQVISKKKKQDNKNVSAMSKKEPTEKLKKLNQKSGNIRKTKNKNFKTDDIQKNIKKKFDKNLLNPGQIQNKKKQGQQMGGKLFKKNKPIKNQK